MDLVLVRHGEPVRLTSSDTSGKPADPALTERGHAQAARLCDWLSHETFDTVITSSKLRAIETAAPIAALLGITPIVDDGWLEYDARADDYIPMEELRATKDPRMQAMIDGRWQEFGGAHPDEFRAQVSAALDRTISTYAGKRVLVVCHGGVINTAIALVIGLDRHLWFEPVYTSISRVVASRSGVRSVSSVNESAHLYAQRQLP